MTPDTSDEDGKLPVAVRPACYPQLLEYRQSKDLTLRPCPLMKPSVSLRYYQVTGVLHLLKMTRMVLGDGTGIGKCVSGDTLIQTDKGLAPIKTLSKINIDEIKTEGFYPSVDTSVFVENRWLPVKKFYYSGVKPTRQVTTKRGYRIEGSLVHPIKVRTNEGGEVFKTLSQIEVGDRVLISRNTGGWPSQNPVLSTETNRHGFKQGINLPSVLTPNLAKILGYLVAEGTVTQTQSYQFTQWSRQILDDYMNAHMEVFGFCASHTLDGCVSHSVKTREYLYNAGLEYDTARFKITPWCIFQGDRECVKSYLQALFEGDASSKEGYIEMTMASERIIRETQILLLRFGIVSQLGPHYNKKYDYTYWRVSITGENARLFHNQIGFISSEKKKSVQGLTNNNTNIDTINGCGVLMGQCWGRLRDSLTKTGSNENRKGSGIKKFGCLRKKVSMAKYNIRPITYDALNQLSDALAASNIESDELNSLISNHYFYDTVEDISEKTTEVMDIEVDDPSHTFIGNGFVNHNTIQLVAAYAYMLTQDPKLKLIIVTPKSATSQWVDEFAKFTDGIDVARLENNGVESREQQYQDFFMNLDRNVLVMHYHFFREDYRLYSPYMDGKKVILVLDEASAVKSTTSQVHKVAVEVSAKCSRVYGLTATLLKNNLLEGYAIYKVIYAPIYGTLTGFKKKYCIEKKQSIGKGRQIPVVVGYKNVAHFRDMMDPYFIGRNKYDVSTELPALLSKEIEVGMSDAQWALYGDALGDFLTVVREGEEQEKEMTALTRLNYFQQIVNSPEVLGREGKSEKEEELYRLLSDDLEGEKVIVYSGSKVMVNIIEKKLKTQGYEVARISGDEDEYQRTLNKLMFQEDKEALQRFLVQYCSDSTEPKLKAKVLKSCKAQLAKLKEGKYPTIILLTPAGTEALNLQKASTFIFYDLPYEPGNYDQLIGRMIRIGSEHAQVLVIHLKCKGTIDGYKLQIIKKKSKVIRQVLGEQTKGALEFDTTSDLKSLRDQMNADAIAYRKNGRKAIQS